MNTATPSLLSQNRLSQEQVESYHREGYLTHKKPVFSESKFNALKTHFEEKLSRLEDGQRPEGMDVPHFTDIKLFDWLFADEVLDLVEPLIGPDIALFSSHFICKPKGNGKRVPWHEDSAYWGTSLQPMDVATVWLAIDPSTCANGCMNVIPRTQFNGYSDYESVDTATHVFPTEIKRHQFNANAAVPIELKPNQASIHHAKLIHGSEANTSSIRRCGYTMRYISTRCRYNEVRETHRGLHQIYLARGRDHAGNTYADPTKTYESLARFREKHVKHGH